MTLGSLAQPAHPGLATRKGISWGFAAPTEDSSVLVLTMPSRHYVDVRFALSGPATDGPFWAFAGTVKYTSLFDPTTVTGGECQGVAEGWQTSMRGEWAHPIDSSGNVDGVDKADIFVLANGSDQIETGTLENPDTGKIEPFREYWVQPSYSDEIYPCVRAQFTDEAGALKGMVLRVGQWAQGIRQVGPTKVEVVRWLLEDGEWREVNGSASAAESIPIAWVTETRETGEKKVLQGREWVVEEVHLA